MEIRRLDLDVAIYRDRVQITDRVTDEFADQRAEFPFSSDASLVAQPSYLEDTIVRAIRKILAGGFSLRHPMAHVVRTDGPLTEGERAIVGHALREAGMGEVIFEID